MREEENDPVAPSIPFANFAVINLALSPPQAWYVRLGLPSLIYLPPSRWRLGPRGRRRFAESVRRFNQQPAHPHAGLCITAEHLALYIGTVICYQQPVASPHRVPAAPAGAP